MNSTARSPRPPRGPPHRHGLPHALLAGELPPPPISRPDGPHLVGVADGEAVFTCTPDESVYNPIGLVHGGLVCTLLDSAIGCAVQTQLAAGTGYTSLELKVSYLRPVRPTPAC